MNNFQSTEDTVFLQREKIVCIIVRCERNKLALPFFFAFENTFSKASKLQKKCYLVLLTVWK